MTEENNAWSFTDLEHVMVICRIFVAKVFFRISEGSLEMELEHVILFLVVSSKSHRGKGGRYFLV